MIALGVYLRDLTFIEVGNPSKLENELTNFDKLRMISLVLKEVLKHQQMHYRFEEVPMVIQYLKQAPKLTEEALHQYSSLCEPTFSSMRKQ